MSLAFVNEQAIPRPDSKFVDFKTSRFIVWKSCGVHAGGKFFKRWDELERGVLSENALREIYEPPLSLIEVLDFAIRHQDFIKACQDRDTTCSDDPGTDDVFEFEGPPVQPAPLQACPVCSGPIGSCDCAPDKGKDSKTKNQARKTKNR